MTYRPMGIDDSVERAQSRVRKQGMELFKIAFGMITL